MTEVYGLTSKAVIDHKGGTQHKADVHITDGSRTIPISIKKKKKLSGGSFDYINSSSALSSSIFNGVKQEAKRIKNSKNSVSTERKAVNTVCYNTMLNMTSDDLKDILTKYVLKANTEMSMLITETSTKAVYTYNFKDTPLAESIKSHTPKFKWGRGKTSAKIVFQDDKGNTLDHGIRIRLVSNNGIRAMMGKSKANKRSVPVIKIQQDRVSGMLKELTDKNIAKKWR